jgi:hypothetical protein
MANGVAALLLAQDVHWLSADGTPQQINAMQDEDCHAALDLIEMDAEADLEQTLIELRAGDGLIGADTIALMILEDLIREIGPGWLMSTPLVCALRDRSLVGILA